MSKRIDVKKTYKLFIGGAFPRTESGRTYEVKNSRGVFIANPCLASRKDLKDAVVAARAAHSGWAHATAYNRGQILYRIAEMLEGRRDQFVAEISELTGVTPKKAQDEVEASIDLLVWYAGWTDKISALDGATNPVAGPYFNFTIPESLGVVGFIAPKKSALLGFVAGIAPIITSGNTVIALASESAPLPAMSLAEVIATSDVPAGVVNILTGKSAELAPWFASHMDIDGLDISGLEAKLVAEIKKAGAQNLKRIHSFKEISSPGRILAFMESKTVWHPIGV
ncbi:MAG: aldehyde dehydrogenase family protein [Actinobacteria bacterium]|jgi:acyl-CoA reductase-like NAD-dependent aldehyde dehydrogenase|nr:aldehyde dehydrogenase family protein [Actinomycetota bacterium]NDH80535.1 aldehyde dehydrogenase family protein [Actinomycetota bacterium]NDH98948.1 aldehyde dehydrogenase family protein [Actinomycetota bacterium]